MLSGFPLCRIFKMQFEAREPLLPIVRPVTLQTGGACGEEGAAGRIEPSPTSISELKAY